MRQLWAPWRISYIRNKDEKGCVFCSKQKSNNDKIIVMRASNMSPIKRYFRGSKPLSVMNGCNVPILIVK